MPPKRSKRKPASRSTTTTRKPNVPAQTPESDVQTAFDLFAVPCPDDADLSDSDHEEGDPVLPIPSARRAVSSLSLAPPPRKLVASTPSRTHMSYASFLALVRAVEAMPSQDDEEEQGDDRGKEGDEVAHAFSLFTKAERITLADLKRVARELREDVDEGTLRLMMEEANGERGARGVQRGVGKGEFEAVMSRAGVFS